MNTVKVDSIKTNRTQFKYNDIFVIAEIFFKEEKNQDRKLIKGGYLNLCFLNTDSKGINHQNVEAKVFVIEDDIIKLKNYELSHNYYSFVEKLLKIEKNKKENLAGFYNILFHSFEKESNEIIPSIDFATASCKNQKPYYYFSKPLPNEKRIPKKNVNKIISIMGHKFYDKLSEKKLNIEFTNNIEKARICPYREKK